MKKKDTQKVALVNCITDIINTVNVSKKPKKNNDVITNTVAPLLATSIVAPSLTTSIVVSSYDSDNINDFYDINEKYNNKIGIYLEKDLIRIKEIIKESYQTNDETLQNCYLLGEGMFGKTYHNEKKNKPVYALKVIIKKNNKDENYYNMCFDELVVVKKIQENFKNINKKELNIINIEKWMFVDDGTNNNNKPLVSFIMDKYEFSLNDLIKAFYTVNLKGNALINQKGGKITFKENNLMDDKNNSCDDKDNNKEQLNKLIEKLKNYFILNTKIQTLKIRRLCDTIMKQVATGLKQIHESGFIHFDIKPDNIMINGLLNNEENFNEYLTKIHVYIIDFGLAQYIGKQETIELEEDRGTPLYYPPESFESIFYTFSKKVDIYSFGKTCFYLYGGIDPKSINNWKESENLLYLIKSVKDGTYYIKMKTFMENIVIDKFNFFGLNKNLKDEILKCLDKEPKERPIAEDLESFFSETF
jgi:serine/threonine protein kinase